MTSPVIALLILLMAAKEPSLRFIFDLASRGDVATLVSLNSPIDGRNSSLRSNALNVALLIADPLTYSDHFIEHFPITSDAVMHELYEEIELKKYTPEFLFSLKSLGRLAHEGSAPAAVKLLRAVLVADGVVSDQLCEDVNATFADRPALMLRALSSLSSDRGEIYSSCFDLLDERQRECILLKINGPNLTDDIDKVVLGEVRAALNPTP